MRILYISSSWLHGQAFGGQLRALHIGRALQQIGEVTVKVVGSDANDIGAELKTRVEFLVERPICPEPRPNRTTLEKLHWAFDPHYMNVHGFVASPEERKQLASSFAQYNLVWVLNCRTPNLLHHWHWPNAHLDLDDIPSTYLRSISDNTASIRVRWKAGIQRLLLKRRELLFKERFGTLSVCSEEDRHYLRGGERIHVIPNGFERPLGEPARRLTVESPRIGFIGLYTYAPNMDGVRWFLKECWPVIRRAVPGIRFRLAGKGTDGPSSPTDPDVDVLGWVSDPADEIATWSVMVIPIKIGGGTRIKVADAFSRKCPVVSTSLGAFGYTVEDGKQLRLADAPSDFAAACIDAVRNPVQAAAMADRAWNDFLEKWSWDAIAPKVWAAAEDCLRRGSGAAS